MFVFELRTINKYNAVTGHSIAMDTNDLEIVIQRFRKELPKYKDDVICDCIPYGAAHNWTEE